MSITSAAEIRSQAVSPLSILMAGRYAARRPTTVAGRLAQRRGSVPAARVARYSVETVWSTTSPPGRMAMNVAGGSSASARTMRAASSWPEPSSARP